MIFKIQHEFSTEIFVPWCAISDNVDFIMAKERQVETADGVIADIVEIKYLHALSQESAEIVKRIYRMQIFSYLEKWYLRNKMMSSLQFVYLKVRKNG